MWCHRIVLLGIQIKQKFYECMHPHRKAKECLILVKHDDAGSQIQCKHRMTEAADTLTDILLTLIATFSLG